ncbi:MAG: transketolase [Malacoplasma sp.]
MKKTVLNENKNDINKGKNSKPLNLISRFSDLSTDTIRILGVEAIAKANSGHPGIVLGAAPIMYALFRENIVTNPNNPNFLNRDRFVLSAGHGSALLYATMHLAGYKISLDDLKNFRNINSITAGHPENFLIDGIDATTGPLGQGVSLAVGMAIAETKLSSYFKKYKLFNHYTYCLFGDGCFQEGIFHESLSIAAKLKLNKLIFLYDSNNIQLDGKVSDSTEINTKKYFDALGVNYIKVENGNDSFAISEAIKLAKTSEDKPTVIEIKTIIGYKSIYENSNKAHGNALNDAQIKELKDNLSYHNDRFEVSKNAYIDFEPLIKRGQIAENNFNRALENLKKDSQKFSIYTDLVNKSIELNEKDFLSINTPNLAATRNISGDIIQTIAKQNPLITLLSADISSSTKIWMKDSEAYSSTNRIGINLNAGVREFAMNGICAGITIHSGLKAMTSTFLSFADYNKAAIRLAAISKNPMISVYSHDSISVGEDGPTHQPIEQIWSLRLIPNHVLFRPCNFNETLEAFKYALASTDHPVTIITSRLEFDQINSKNKGNKGGYVLQSNKSYDITLVATGSEIAVANRVSAILEKDYKVKSNIVSMPSVELFMKQSLVYRNHILGNKPVISIEFGSTYPWFKVVDFAIGINKFGYSGKFADVTKKMKLTDTDIAEKIINYLENNTKIKIVNKKI